MADSTDFRPTNDPAPQVRPDVHFSSKDVVLGSVVDIDAVGVAWVDYPGNPEKSPLKSLSTTPIGKDDIGRQAALLFVDGDSRKPIVMGLVRTILDQINSPTEPAQVESDKRQSVSGLEPVEMQADRSDEVYIDGERLVFQAEREIVLKCGKASITLTRAGKILIRGAYLLNRSSGVNRIKGGSVQIN